MRMLDNVIDINYYAGRKRAIPTCAIVRSARYHGFPRLLVHHARTLRKSRSGKFADTSMEAGLLLRLFGINVELAQERGRYSSYTGSCGIVAFSARFRALVAGKNAVWLFGSRFSETMDWSIVRDRIKQYGMRNSNCATAPTATISNIIGVSYASNRLTKTCM